jgi:hypothetical protein
VWLTSLTRRFRSLTKRSRAQNRRHAGSNRRPSFRPFLEVLEDRASPSTVGYVNDWLNGTGDAKYVTAAGDTAVQLTDADLGSYNLNSLDALVLGLSTSGRSPTLMANWENVLNWVQQGGRLIIHDGDPGANASQPVAPGLNGASFTQAGSQFMSVLDPSSAVVNGPFGVIDNHSFDWGVFSSHGYVDASTLPSWVNAVMSNRSTQNGPADANQVTVLNYNYGGGYVSYSTVPAEYYTSYYGYPGWQIGTNVNTVYLPNELNAALTANLAPVANAGGPYALTEGNSLTLNAGASTDADGDKLTYGWDLTGKSLYADASGVSPTLSWAQLQNLGINDEGSYAVSVQVSDGRGGVSVASTTLTVNSAAPAVNPLADAVLNEGGTFTATGSFTDPGADAWTATVDYGDGSGPTALALNADKTFSLSHLYTGSGNHQVTVAVTDGEGGVGQGSPTVTVNNVAPQVSLNLPPNAMQGTTLTASCSFSDPGTEQWTATVDYGDGTGTHPLALNPDQTFHLSHVYARNGNFNVTVKVADGNGGVGSASAAVTATGSKFGPAVTILTPTKGSLVPRFGQLTGQVFTRDGSWPVVLIHPLLRGEPWYVQPEVRAVQSNGTFADPIYVGNDATPVGTQFALEIVMAPSQQAAYSLFPVGKMLHSLPAGLPVSKIVTVHR